jgi:hypothetical protein
LPPPFGFVVLEVARPETPAVQLSLDLFHAAPGQFGHPRQMNSHAATLKAA